jgi:hypothetical protein
MVELVYTAGLEPAAEIRMGVQIPLSLPFTGKLAERFIATVIFVKK